MAGPSLEEWAPEAVVIGSGFGGAVAACRLAQAGFRTLVLERGRRYGAGDFPALPDDSALLPDLRRYDFSSDQGLWDVVDLGELVSVQAAGYGGGSLVYANVHLRPPRAVFDDRWPARFRARAELDSYFDLAAYMLGVRPSNTQPEFAAIEKARALGRAAERLGRKDGLFHPPIAVSFADGDNVHGFPQRACTACGRCCMGCAEKAKNTLDHNYLALAERHGARVRTLTEVDGLEEQEDGSFVVRYLDHATGATGHARAKYVFLCAGSVHTTRLLAGATLRRPEVKTKVGVGYFPGGDALGIVYDTDRAERPEHGPVITTALVHAESADKFFMIQDGGYPAALDRMMGFLRAPAWLGRNRLSNCVSATEARDEPIATSTPEPAPLFHLPSAPDEILAAALGGQFAALGPPQLKQSLPALLAELKRVLLLPAIADRTLDLTLRAFCARTWPFAWLDREGPAFAWVVSALGSFAKRFVATPDELANNVLRATLELGGMKPQQILRDTLGYDGTGGRFRTMLLAMGRDAAPGLLQYDASKRAVQADLDLYHLAPGYSNEERLMTDVARELGGELRINPAWAFLGKPITVHNQGGCRMSDDPAYGVVTPDGRVHGSAALYVLDGAALCTSVGVNPSATITALAEHHVHEFIRLHAPEKPNAAGLAQYETERSAAARFGEHARASGWHLEPPTPPAVAFGAEPLGLSFTEAMDGYYLPGRERPETDPGFRERETLGRPDYPLRVELTVTAKNLTVFFEDMTHAMEVGGTIRVRLPNAAAVQPYAVTGRLELMVPRYKPHGVTPAERERLMAQEFALLGRSAFDALSAVELGGLGTASFPERRHKTIAGRVRPGEERFLKYFLRFAANGEHWVLYGYKRVKDDPGFDAWRDTSSLFVQLFAVPDEPDLQALPGPACLRGAGVIHVDINDFVFDQLASMKVTGTEDPARIAFALGKFTAFFFGALQRVYVPELGKVAETFFGGLVG
jgi:choline dehydrogenase-like flavoprotein